MISATRSRTAVFVFALLSAGAAGAQATITVSPHGPIRTLTAAIVAASRHSRIVVKPGVYREPTIMVDKPVEIIGEGWPVLDGASARQIMTVTADSVTIRGLHFEHVGTSFTEDWAAVRFQTVRGCTIEGNRFDDAFFGIYLAKVNDCTIRGNVLRSGRGREMNSGNGIHLWASNGITIADNRIAGHRDGIYFEFVHNSVISGNVSELNLRYGLHFMYSDDCRYLHNTFRKNGSGVAVMFTNRVEMTGNRFEENWGGAAYGLLLKEIGDSKLEGNVFYRNTTGLLADGANRIKAIRNDFIDNGWAVKLQASTQDGTFTGNNFIGNTFDVSANNSESTTTFARNYWDNYRGYDLNHDGFGDVAYHPVRLFSMVVAQNGPSIILLRSTFVRLLDSAESIIPALTPEALADREPAMKRVK
ncbi:MAG TPA: nitrous oxide reductase family maturation protein NosD [Gemmatimonadaceae bacterium]|nr:nitrous oxide reductase family maturation protein NosD [Gemmatimonadaceae bacterium]